MESTLGAGHDPLWVVEPRPMMMMMIRGINTFLGFRFGSDLEQLLGITTKNHFVVVISSREFGFSDIYWARNEARCVFIQLHP